MCSCQTSSKPSSTRCVVFRVIPQLSLRSRPVHSRIPCIVAATFKPTQVPFVIEHLVLQLPKMAPTGGAAREGACSADRAVGLQRAERHSVPLQWLARSASCASHHAARAHTMPCPPQHLHRRLFKSVLCMTWFFMHYATGTGKTLAAEAIGFETGKPLKVRRMCDTACRFSDAPQ